MKTFEANFYIACIFFHNNKTKNRTLFRKLAVKNPRNAIFKIAQLFLKNPYFYLDLG